VTIPPRRCILADRGIGLAQGVLRAVSHEAQVLRKEQHPRPLALGPSGALGDVEEVRALVPGGAELGDRHPCRRRRRGHGGRREQAG